MGIKTEPMKGEIVSWGEFFRLSTQDWGESDYIRRARESAKAEMEGAATSGRHTGGGSS